MNLVSQLTIFFNKKLDSKILTPTSPRQTINYFMAINLSHQPFLVSHQPLINEPPNILIEPPNLVKIIYTYMRERLINLGVSYLKKFLFSSHEFD